MSVFEDLANLDAGLKAVAATASSAAASVERDAGRIAGAVAAAQANADQIGQAVDKISEQIAKGANVWSEELQLQIELLNVGGQRVDQFLAKWGDAVIQTENGAETIRQAFDTLDVRGREQQIQELIVAIRRGSEGVQDALAFLATAQGKYADELRKTVEQVQKGQAPIEKLLALVQQIKAQFGGTAYADLAQALADAARTGDLS